MSARAQEFFLDTSIFVYTFDEAAPVRRAQARELVELALTTGMGTVSYQVIQEFLNVATAKFRSPTERSRPQAIPGFGPQSPVPGGAQHASLPAGARGA